MKILYVATIGGFMPFFKTIIRELLDDGHTVDIATNMTEYPLPDYYKEWGCGIYQISCSRSPISKGNLIAINEISNIVKENHYDIVHCHTPLAAMCTRVACRKIRKLGTRVIYTVHGFHFYKGAPLKNWLIFCTVERICAKWTDVLITINKEDYAWAKKHLRINQIEYIPGVGIDVDKFSNDPTNKATKREELGIPVDAYVLLSLGELNVNKNHQIVVKALAEIHNQKIYYIIAGKGDQEKSILSLSKSLKISNRVHLIGYRNDASELYKMADVYVLPSIREGLNVSVMEAMSSGLPCIVSDIRGNRDMIDDKMGGCLVNPQVIQEFCQAINMVRERGESYGQYNLEKAEMFDSHTINRHVREIYEKNNVAANKIE